MNKDVQAATTIGFLTKTPLKHAMDVVKTCFPEQPVGISRDTRYLQRRASGVVLTGGGCVSAAASESLTTVKPADMPSSGRREALVSKLYALAGVEPPQRAAKSKLSSLLGKSDGLSFGHILLLSKTIKFSEFLDACVEAWVEQSDADKIGMQEVYQEYDADRNGVLSYSVRWCFLARLSVVLRGVVMMSQPPGSELTLEFTDVHAGVLCAAGRMQPGRHPPGAVLEVVQTSASRVVVG